MASDDVPPQLKSMKRFLREAKKIEKVKPVVAYYCRMYAIQETMKLPREKKDATVKQWLGEQMTYLEKLKVNVTPEEAQNQITTLADTIFAQTDKVDRSGNATKSTAAAFNTCFILYEILKQFGERSEEITNRSKYCLFKTTDILKALREGRRPDPGPPGGGDENDEELERELKKITGEDNNDMKDNNEQEENTTNNDSNTDANNDGTDDVPMEPKHPSTSNGNNNRNPYAQPPSQPSYPSNPSYPSYPYPSNPYYPSNPSPNSSTPSQPSNSNSSHPSTTKRPSDSKSPSQPSHYGDINNPNFKKFENKVVACAEAEKAMKHAFAAMKFNDVNAAIEKLQEAIFILQPHKNS